MRGATVDAVLDWLRRHASPGAALHLDSRHVQTGDVFFACPGRQSDGRMHVLEAVARGAAAVVVQADPQHSLPATTVPVLAVENLAALLGELAHVWYGRASEQMTVVAVTGTNGKTTTTQWLAAALCAAGVPCAVIGTLGLVFPDGSTQAGSLTTPDVLSLHRQLAALHRAGARVVALEASSIGLEQGRLDGVAIHVAAFTNLTHDHLDYHHTMQAYQAAKFGLFERAGVQHAVVNMDDAAGQALAQHLSTRQTDAPALHTYALHNRAADFRARDIRTGAGRNAAGMDFTLITPAASVPVATQAVGQHNIANMLLVAAVLSVWADAQEPPLQTPLAALLAALLGNLRPVDGRMQTVQWQGIQTTNAPLVVVDYAHTPDALERALQALRTTATARGGMLHCVFGCGGNRDRSKRPVMGALAQQHADRVVLTSDNPRGEDPLEILDEIRSGMVGDVAPAVQVQPDRALAILAAIWQAQPADVVLIAGKGHETYQEVHGQRQPFDDRVWAQLALALAGGTTLHTDTRTLQAGQLFVALAGENFDGHDWLDAAQRAGACAALVSRVQSDCTLPQLAVNDTRAALGKLGQAWRARFDLPLIAVTGSNGKTTVKDMLADIFNAWQGQDAVLATRGNLNNDLGVPLTLLRLTAAHRAAVVELGMNHTGEIAPLAAMAQPTVALVNNAQREHLEFMHSVENVAHENGSVLAALRGNEKADGVAVYPADDDYTALWDALAGARPRLRFGLRHGEVHASDIAVSADGCRCRVHTPQGQGALTLPLPGQHNLRNALAAIACALAVGVPLQTALATLTNFTAVKGRMQRMQLPDGSVLIDDTYNANPDSVCAAIDVLAQLPAPRALVLGDMGEVGTDGPALHVEVGAYAHERGIEILFTVGEAGKHVCAGYAKAGYCAADGGRTTHSFDSAAAAEPLAQRLASLRPASVLVKGSRVMRMERVVAAYQQQVTGATPCCLN